jgi:hypothetical protein
MAVGSGIAQIWGALLHQGCWLLVIVGSTAGCAATASESSDEHQLGDRELWLNGGSAGEGAQSAPVTTSGKHFESPAAGGEAGAGNWQRRADTGNSGGGNGSSVPSHDRHAAGSSEPGPEDASNAQEEPEGALIGPSTQQARAEADAVGAGAGAAASAHVPGLQQCQDVCHALSACQGAAVASCSDICAASHWVESHGLRCLALRILWIDEEGCGRMLATYAAFSPGDRCE